MVDVDFSEREDGQVDATLGPGWPLFNHALADSVSSLPPRGASGNGPSTYWIDLALERSRQAAEAGDERPFTWGNITELSVRNGEVVARYDYADPDEPGEALPLDEFLDLLNRWRTRVLESARRATLPLPDTSRRNPVVSTPTTTPVSRRDDTQSWRRRHRPTLTLVPAVVTRTLMEGSRTRYPKSHFLDFTVDGASLREVTRERDLVTALNRPWLASVPEAVDRLLGLRPAKELNDGRVALLVCAECGDFGCDAITARLTVDADVVTWSDFHYGSPTSEPAVVKALPASFVFDRQEYEETLRGAQAVVAALPFDEADHTPRRFLWPWQWGWRLPRRPTARRAGFPGNDGHH